MAWKKADSLPQGSALLLLSAALLGVASPVGELCGSPEVTHAAGG